MEQDGGLKRPLAGNDDNRPPSKKLRFPKGKKSKPEGRLDAEGGYDLIGSDLAAKERAKRRTEKKEKDLFGCASDISISEVHYEDDSNFEIDGVEIEPFNLKQEMEEGYFDENGNYVEYRHEQEIKDAWLDNVSSDSRFTEKIPVRHISEEVYEDLSLEDIQTMKKRITSILQPGETIIHALKRLKGISLDKRAKMSESTKLLFDQLTDDAMKLMENDVYHQVREAFELEIASKDDDKFDMFGDDDNDNVDGNLLSDEATLGSTASGQITRSPSDKQEASQNFDSTNVTGGSESDYVYDPTSGYYYNGLLGYYYDPMSKLYCCAESGVWYSFDEQLGIYTEISSISMPQET